MYYYTQDNTGRKYYTPSPCYSVSEAREYFIACGIYMAIDPQCSQSSDVQKYRTSEQ
jgi:hypothetical protein